MESHHTLQEREVVAHVHRAGKMQTQIALRLGRSKSTISREVRRNCSRNGYRAVAAHRKSGYLLRGAFPTCRPPRLAKWLRNDFDRCLRPCGSPSRWTTARSLPSMTGWPSKQP